MVLVRDARGGWYSESVLRPKCIIGIDKIATTERLIVLISTYYQQRVDINESRSRYQEMSGGHLDCLPSFRGTVV